MSIMSLINQIQSNEVVLPAIQRDFVWSTVKIERLMDSLMRGYPIGLALLWETYEDIQFRPFTTAFRQGVRHTYSSNASRRRLKVVLDGQQRLQSLHLALHGTHEGEALYLDVLSGDDSDDLKEDRYYFHFLTPDVAKQLNEDALEAARESGDPADKWHLPVSQLVEMSSKERLAFRKQLTKQLELDDEIENRLDLNLARLDEVLHKDEHALKVSVVDADLSPRSKNRKTESDVLEIFVRINRQGTPLSRSDLIFSMIKLGWRESAEDLPAFVDAINEGNSFALDTDFVIRSLFAVSDLGTKFDVDLLRNKTNIGRLKENFSRCCDAIRSTVDIVQRECWCSNSRVLGNYNTLVPFVYYLFHLPGQQVPDGGLDAFRKSLYLFGFATPFSRWADSRLKRFIDDALTPALQESGRLFPLPEAASWVTYWERLEAVDKQMLQRNPRLALQLLQIHSGAKTHLRANAPELDHIFPRSVLRRKGYDESLVNHYANFWLLSKGKNQNKSNKHPKQFFEDVSPTDLKRALIDPAMLDYRRYGTFLRSRGGSILSHVRKRLGFKSESMTS